MLFHFTQFLTRKILLKLYPPPSPLNWLRRHQEVTLRGYISSFTQSCPALQPHGLPHTRFPCPSPTPGACSNSCLLSQWCHPTISSSVIPFSCPQSFPESGSFPMSQFFHLRVAKVLELQLQHQSFLSKKFLFCLTGMSLTIRWWLFFVVVTLSAKLSWA